MARKTLLTVTHDAMMKALLSDLRRANAVLRAILAAIAHELLGLPELLNPGFVDEWFATSYKDMVFRYRLRRGGNLYILVEHKSRRTRLVAVQMLGYYVNLGRAYGARQGGHLRAPLMAVSLLLHNGRRDWQAPPSIADLIPGQGAAAELARRQAPDYRPMTVDMKALALDSLAAHPEAWAGWAAMVCGGRRCISRRMLAAILRRLKAKSAFETQVIGYIVANCVQDGKMVEATVKAIKGKRGERIMDKVKHPLVDLGRAEGMAQGMARVLMKLLRLRFGRVPADVQGQVAEATPEQMEAWSAAILTAASLDEVLAAKPAS